MATFNVVLLESRIDKRGRAPLYARVSDKRAHRTKSLSEKVRPSKWNGAKQEVRASHPDAERINADIAELKGRAAAELRRLAWEGGDTSAAALAAALWDEPEPSASDDFFAFAGRWADRLRAEGRIGYWKRARSVLKKFRATVAGPLPLDAFTAGVLERHDRRMADDLGNSPNTRVVAFRLLRTVVRRAIKEGVMEPWDDPFLRFTPPKETKTERGRLTIEDIARIEDLNLEPGSDLDVARDLYLFALYAAGVRFGDVVRLRWENVHEAGGGRRLQYRMGKTNAPQDLALNPKAVAILDKYRRDREPAPDDLVFPVIAGYDLSTAEARERAVSSRNVLVNRSLKGVARRAGVRTHLTFHTARHSFADLARRNGADVYKVSQALGHANLKVTSRYLSGFDSGAADEAVNIAFG